MSDELMSVFFFRRLTISVWFHSTIQAGYVVIRHYKLMRSLVFLAFWLAYGSLWAQTNPVSGTVSEQVNNRTVPLNGASVVWLGTTLGSITDSTGRFSITPTLQTNRLVISYVGYESDTLAIIDSAQSINVTLRASRTLQEVTVAGASSQIDRIAPIQTELLTIKTLAKAACCNLSESFETNASVSVSYSDAVTGAKQIQFLGLGGQYVQTNVENIPTVRGLASTFGLNYIPGTWITSIDVGKGAGSVVNGYEAMTGQLNVELQKPDVAIGKPNLFFNGYVNSFGRVEGNVNWAKTLNKHWSVAGLGHVSTLQTDIDQNRDGFRDLPLYNQINGIGRAKYTSDRWMAQFGVKALTESREGGQTKSAGGFQPYRFTNDTRRVEVFSKTARLFPDKPYRGLGLIINGLYHDQTAGFGFTPYTGRQQSLYANLIYQTIIGTTDHGLKTGLSYVYDNYRENYALQPLDRTESVPGAFVEYTYNYLSKLTVVLGGRLDAYTLQNQQYAGPTQSQFLLVPNTLFRWQATPRLHLRYQATDGLTVRLTTGRGFRTPNQLAENFGYLVSSRKVNLNRDIQPEVSWNYGISLTQETELFGKKVTIIADFHRTDFQNQLVADFEHPREIYFYNTNGAKSYANSFQIEANYSPAKRLEIKAAYRLFDVQQTMGGDFGEARLLPRMMVSRDRVLVNAGYALPFDKWKFDATLQYNGPKRIPYLRPGYSHQSYLNMPTDVAPGFVNLNAQVSKAFRSGLEVYLGGENLTGFRQPDPIINASQPFSGDFDAAARTWGPITGAMVYAGFRYNLTRP